MVTESCGIEQGDLRAMGLKGTASILGTLSKATWPDTTYSKEE